MDIIEKTARKYVDSFHHPALHGGENGRVSEPLKSEGDEVLVAARQTRQGRADDPGIEKSSTRTDKAGSPGGKCSEENAAFGIPRSKLLGEEVSPDDVDIAHVDMIGDEQSDCPEQTTCSPSEEEPTRRSYYAMNQSGVLGAVASKTAETACGSPEKTPPSAAGDQPSGSLGVTRPAPRPLPDRLNCLQGQLFQMAARLERLQSEAAAAGCPKTGVFDAEWKMVNKSFGDMVNEVRAIEAEALAALPGDKGAQPSQRKPGEEAARRSMEAYARETRGLSLESLSIHLVPVKASVLSRGVDLTHVRQLTLLNVGNQAPVWSLLAKEGRTRRLALRSVFTDHVTTAFLSCMAQLPELHDLFVLERSAKHRPESFAPRTTTTIVQIWRLVLRRHVATLRRLMIKDETMGPRWDVGEKTMVLLCTRGALLEELALSMNIHAVVSAGRRRRGARLTRRDSTP